MALLLMFGVLVGFAVKTEAAKRLTMGFDDATIAVNDTNAYDVNVMQKDLLAKGASTPIASGAAFSGGSCGQ
jgi:hypothetical protein